MSFELSPTLQKRLDALNKVLDILFYITFALIIARIQISASMLDPSYAGILPARPLELAFNVLVNATLILAAVNLVTRAKLTWDTVLAAACLVFSVIVRLRIGYWSMSYLALSLAAAAYERSGKIMLRISVITTAVLSVLLYVLSLNGFIGWIVTEGRHAFGWNYSTDAAARVFYAFAALFVLREGRPNVFYYILLAVSVLMNLLFMQAKTALALSLILLLGTLIYQYLIFPKMKPRRKKKRRAASDTAKTLLTAVLEAPLVLAAPLLAVGMMHLTRQFTDAPSAFYNRFSFLASFRSRLEIGRAALSNYAVTLFGQHVPQRGNGGFTIPDGDAYFYIDSSYIRVLVMYGSVIFIFALLLYAILSLRAAAAGNIYLLCILALIAVDSVTEQYFLNPACNPFFLLVFTNADIFRRRRGVAPDKSAV